MAIARNIKDKTIEENALILVSMQSSGISHDVHVRMEKYSRSKTSAPVKTTAPVSRNLELSGVDDKTAALIIGITCAQLKKNPSELVFNSITAL